MLDVIIYIWYLLLANYMIAFDVLHCQSLLASDPACPNVRAEGSKTAIFDPC
jgi:hypothetical protein